MSASLEISPWMWGAFALGVLVMLALDLGVFHRKAHEVRFREALLWSIVWIAISLLFNAFVWHRFGSEKGVEFLTGYLIEKALSVDNIFIFVLLFSAFAVPKALQHRVLFWGVIGALVMRGLFIAIGSVLLQRFHWILYLFGALLVVTGIRLMVRTEEVHPERNPLFRLFRRVVPAVSDYHGGAFTVVKDGRRFATPLLLVLVAIEATDLVFAVDSIPAIFAVTTDPFIVYTSNVFAIFGLRALYFLLAGVIDRFALLKYSLAAILVFVGAKMLIAGVYKVPLVWSLGIIAALLAAGVGLSLLRTRPEPRPVVGTIAPHEDRRGEHSDGESGGHLGTGTGS